ncbi:MAG TPA: hypothetical protein PKU97_06230 [Kofleriaceae bacterium]|nr:hypothetical protein [Kofleriaceae bacterium]
MLGVSAPMGLGELNVWLDAWLDVWLDVWLNAWLVDSLDVWLNAWLVWENWHGGLTAQADSSRWRRRGRSRRPISRRGSRRQDLRVVDERDGAVVARDLAVAVDGAIRVEHQQRVDAVRQA